MPGIGAGPPPLSEATPISSEIIPTSSETAPITITDVVPLSSSSLPLGTSYSPSSSSSTEVSTSFFTPSTSIPTFSTYPTLSQSSESRLRLSSSSLKSLTRTPIPQSSALPSSSSTALAASLSSSPASSPSSVDPTKLGIGLGVPLGVLLLALVIFLSIYIDRRRRQPLQPKTRNVTNAKSSPFFSSLIPGVFRTRNKQGNHLPPYEVDGEGKEKLGDVAIEIQGTDEPIHNRELQGSAGVWRYELPARNNTTRS